MRRIMLLLAVVALVAVMMVVSATAGFARADCRGAPDDRPQACFNQGWHGPG